MFFFLSNCTEKLFIAAPCLIIKQHRLYKPNFFSLWTKIQGLCWQSRPDTQKMTRCNERKLTQENLQYQFCSIDSMHAIFVSRSLISALSFIIPSLWFFLGIVSSHFFKFSNVSLCYLHKISPVLFFIFN